MLYVLLGLPSGALPSTSTILTSWYFHCPLTVATPSLVLRLIFLVWASAAGVPKAAATIKAARVFDVRIRNRSRGDAARSRGDAPGWFVGTPLGRGFAAMVSMSQILFPRYVEPGVKTD